jgi:para-nitrobenzyl esterase
VGSGADRIPLQDTVSRAWTAFARAGNPNHAGLAPWREYKHETGATMLFNDTCTLVDRPDPADIEAQSRLPLYQMVRGS